MPTQTPPLAVPIPVPLPSRLNAPPPGQRYLNPPSRAIPDEIEAAMLRHPIFDPSLERKEYKEGRDLWQLYLDLLEPDGIKVAKMVEKHHDQEDEAKICLRRRLAVAFNLVPTLVSMVKGYIFAEEPVIEVGDDPDLTAFLANCDGAGTGFVQYCRETVLPLAMCMGHLDVLVQNPLVIGDIHNAAEAADTGAAPTLYAITPLQRINWSSTLAGDYNWLCFKDSGNENPWPLFRDIKVPESYVTVSAANEQFPDSETGLWIRSWRPWYVSTDGKVPDQMAPGQFAAPTPEANPLASGQFVHEADWTPTRRVPVATIYWQRSNDPQRRHTGISKIAMIAVLTKKIIQILSWLDEDVLANLALIALPTRGGQPPKKPTDDGDGDSDLDNLNAFSTLNFDSEGKHAPFVLQGSVDHIRVKLEVVASYLQEILRLSHLTFGTTAKAERVTSGVQAVVQRNELFRELQDTAGNMDRFVLDVLALVKSWASGEEWTADDVRDKLKVSVSFNKGPYAADTAADAIEQAAAVVAMYRGVSPKLCEKAYKQAAQAYVYGQDPDLPEVLKEIEDNYEAVLAEIGESALLAEAAAIAEGKQTGALTVTEANANPDGASVDGSDQSVPAGTDKKPNAAGDQKPRTPAKAG